VYLNGYKDVPSWLCNKPTIEVARSQDYGDRGDAGKFWWSNKWEGYCFTCDDDLVYPRDYVRRMLTAVNRFHRRVAVGLHGVVVDEKMLSFYRIPRRDHWRVASSEYRPVNVLGTGVLAYHTDMMTVTPTDFEIPNMADVWFALLCQRREVPCVTIPRAPNWLTLLPTGETIYDRHKNDDKVQTDAIRRVWPWRLFEAQE
jgi:hypothetical protein